MISYGNDQGWKYSLNYCIERSQIRRGIIRDSQRQKTISTKKGANISVTLPIKNKHQQNVYIHISMKKKKFWLGTYGKYKRHQHEVQEQYSAHGAILGQS